MGVPYSMDSQRIKTLERESRIALKDVGTYLQTFYRHEKNDHAPSGHRGNSFTDSWQEIKRYR